jgi:hypothetical protein
MRVIVAFLVVGISVVLSACSRPPQTGHSQHFRAKWESQPRIPKLTERSAAKAVTKVSRPVGKRSRKFKTHLVKSTRPQLKAPASHVMGPPARKPEVPHIESRATNGETLPPLPPRKPEQTPVVTDPREHAVEPEAKFMTAKEKAKREGVHALTRKDIESLSQEQIKELRGY